MSSLRMESVPVFTHENSEGCRSVWVRLRVGGSRLLPSRKDDLTKQNEGTNEGTLDPYQARPGGIFLYPGEPAKPLIPLTLSFCHGRGPGSGREWRTFELSRVQNTAATE